MSETTKAPEEWARHERHNDAPRCRIETCQQPLAHPTSIKAGVCRRSGCQQAARSE